MKWARGVDFYDHALEVGATHIAFTANSVVTGGGRLVMGAGAAKRVRDAMPGVDAALGALGPPRDFHLLSVESELWRPRGVLAVQVKRHFKDEGDLDLTRRSLVHLANFCEANREAFVVMNCPLVGRGGFADRADEVEKMVEEVLEEHPVVVTTL